MPKGRNKALDDLTIVVPAWNEEEHIAGLLGDLHRELPGVPIVVVDNNCTDATPAIATQLGAVVVACDVQGKGAACRVGLESVCTSYVFFCDGDIKGILSEPLIRLAEEVISSGAPVGRLTMNRAPEMSPVTTLLVRPVLRCLFPMIELHEPIGGMLFGRTDWLQQIELPDHWAVDVAITMHALSEGRHIPEIVAVGMSHRFKPIGAYVEMAQQIAGYMMASQWA